MKTLNELTKQYEKAFRSVCKKVDRDGMSAHMNEFDDIQEVCIELHIDVEAIFPDYR